MKSESAPNRLGSVPSEAIAVVVGGADVVPIILFISPVAQLLDLGLALRFVGAPLSAGLVRRSVPA